MQRSFQSWRMKCQDPVKFTQSANTQRTRRRQVCIKWWIGAWEVSFLTLFSPKRRSATLRMVVLGLFNCRLMKYHTFSIGFKLGLLLGQFKITTAFKAYQVLCDIRSMQSGPMTKTGPAAGGCWSVTQPERRRPRQNAIKRSSCPGSRPVEFAIKGNVTNTMAEAPLKACRWTQPGWRHRRGQSLTPSVFSAYLARMPRSVLVEKLTVRPMAAAFIPAIEILTTRHC